MSDIRFGVSYVEDLKKTIAKQKAEVERAKLAAVGFMAERDALEEEVERLRADANFLSQRHELDTIEVERLRAYLDDARKANDQLYDEVERLRHQRWAFDETRLSRVTLVDEQGRAYERFGIDVAVSVQDEGRTLKVFVHDQEDPR